MCFQCRNGEPLKPLIDCDEYWKTTTTTTLSTTDTILVFTRFSTLNKTNSSLYLKIVYEFVVIFIY